VTPKPVRRQFLRAAGLATAAVALSGGTALADELQTGQERSDVSSTSGERIPGHRPHVARVIWSVETPRPELALTFDDGPDPELTPRVVEALARAGMTATFLLVGEHVRRNPGIVRDLVAAGHEVGNHTWSHPDLGRVDAAHTARELVDGTAAIEDVTGERVRLFRPPWGHLTGAAMRVAGELGQDVLLWTASEEHVPARLVRGDVLLYHDGVERGATALPRSSSALRRQRVEQLDALPALLERIAAAGLRSVTASALVG
jgi:peptidoglycan/xylan/chitin deacetylase (PgdA/CDA1 family)